MNTQELDNIVAVAAVTGPARGDLECVVRWALGASGNELPHPDDKFTVSLVVDGTVYKQVDVSPMNHAMLDPGRTAALYPAPNDPREWRVAKRPTTPIDPLGADKGDLSDQAVGVIHLLKPTATPMLRFRAAKAISSAYRHIGGHPALAGLSKVQTAHSAVAFADALIISGLRPLHLRQLVAQDFRALAKDTRATGLLRVNTSEITQLAHSVLVMKALAETDLAMILDEVVEQSIQVRNHIRVAGLQGGSMLDYWDDPRNAGTGGHEANRGRLWPGAELIGLGCRVPLPRSQVDAWMRAKQSLTINVAHAARTPQNVTIAELALDNFETLRPIWLPSDRLTFGDVNVPVICPDGLMRALTIGSSHPAASPRGARVDWSMVCVQLAPLPGETTTPESTISFRTGDSKIEICIDRPPPPPMATSSDERTGAGYNLYGVWEGVAEFQLYFDDPTQSPSVDQLRPWLLTRRYSFAKDLQTAFPPIDGQTHPALTAAMAAPAWHPLLKRPDTLQDTSDVNPTDLPNVGDIGDAVFTFDLRTGMAMPPRIRPPVGWDPAGPLALDWTPEKSRDLQALPVGAVRPQRYRFWVTAVDVLGQESDPVAVQAEDVDAGETPTTLFEPRRRTPLAAPPGGDLMQCSFDTSTRTLSVAYETPYESQASGYADPTQPGKRVPAVWLTSQVIIYRRLLLAVQPASRAAAFVPGKLPPQWASLDAELTAAGWSAFTTLTAAAPLSGDAWGVSVVLAEDDLGWQYLATVGMQVAPLYQAFWTRPSVIGAGPGRTLTRVKPANSGGGYTALSDKMDDFTTAGAIARAKPYAISDGKVPWSPDVIACRILAAKPVPAPPGIRRDLVLQRLLERDYVSGGQPVAKAWWGESLLTVGQIAMSREALGRTSDPTGPLPDLDSDALAPARRILARDFHRPAGQAATPGMQQHASVGFRGLADLRWRYTPRSQRPAADKGKNAEAAAFRVYAATVPTELVSAESFATLSGVLSQIRKNVYQLTVTGGEAEALTTISVRPTLAALRSGQQTTYASVVGIKVVGRVHQVELSPYSTPLPASAEGLFFAAQPLDTVPSSGVDAVADYRFLAPIPGGAKAMFAWWVGGVSAAGLETKAGDLSPMRAALLAMSVEPPPPVNLAVRPPVDNSVDFLNPATESDWLPSSISTMGDAQSFPRTVVSWQSPLADDILFLEIERIERQIATPERRRLVAVARTAWEVVTELQSLPEGASIDADDLNLLLLPWLRGGLVDSPVPSGSPTDRWVVFEAGVKDMHANHGVVHLPISGLVENRDGSESVWPSWIDYFGRNRDYVSVMDGNWEFQYRLRTYIDLGVSAGYQRYLYSSATVWSPFVTPETPAIVITPLPPSVSEAEIPKPLVTFAFVSEGSALARALGRHEFRGTHTWVYRIVLRRKSNGPQLSSLADPWIDVGQPIELAFGDSTGTPIVDTEVDRGWLENAPTVLYRVCVQEFMKLDGVNGPRERLVRAFENLPGHDVPVQLRAPASESTEILILQRIQIQ
jgi:hypothetical protein